jgi:hypothetical protein
MGSFLGLLRGGAAAIIPGGAIPIGGGGGAGIPGGAPGGGGGGGGIPGGGAPIGGGGGGGGAPPMPGGGPDIAAGSFADARRVSRGGSFAGAAVIRCAGGCARTPRRLARGAGGYLRAPRTASPDGLDFAGPAGAALASPRSSRSSDVPRDTFALRYGCVWPAASVRRRIAVLPVISTSVLLHASNLSTGRKRRPRVA